MRRYGQVSHRVDLHELGKSAGQSAVVVLAGCGVVRARRVAQWSTEWNHVGLQGGSREARRTSREAGLLYTQPRAAAANGRSHEGVVEHAVARRIGGLGQAGAPANPA